MKTVYITESMAKLLKESILMDALPADIMRSISDGTNPVSHTQLFMGGGENCTRFFERAAMTGFEDAKKALKNIGRIDSVDADTVEDAFNKIVLKCQEIEERNLDTLEKLAVNYLIDLFSIPDDMVKIEARLVRSVTNADDISPVEPFDGDVDFEMADLDDISGMDAEVAKRHFINTINMGAGMKISENIRGYLEPIYDVDPRLPQLYREAISLNNYMIYKKADLGINDKDRKQIGLVDVRFGKSDELVSISAQGVIFPVLLCELIRGMMELFSSHGLPKDRERMEYVLKKSDYLKAEPWQMRFGPYMWEIFSNYFQDTDTSDMPYIYQALSKLSPKTFFKVISEMMAKTKKGRMYAEKILNKAMHKKDEISFKDKMSRYSRHKNIITDGCMSPEEF